MPHFKAKTHQKFDFGWGSAPSAPPDPPSWIWCPISKQSGRREWREGKVREGRVSGGEVKGKGRL